MKLHELSVDDVFTIEGDTSGDTYSFRCYIWELIKGNNNRSRCDKLFGKHTNVNLVKKELQLPLYSVDRDKIVRINKLVMWYQRNEGMKGVCMILNKPIRAIIKIDLEEKVEILGDYFKTYPNGK